jgi:hypothetical protein
MRDVSGPSKSLAGKIAGPLPAAVSGAIARDPERPAFTIAPRLRVLLAKSLGLTAKRNPMKVSSEYG